MYIVRKRYLQKKSAVQCDPVADRPAETDSENSNECDDLNIVFPDKGRCGFYEAVLFLLDLAEKYNNSEKSADYHTKTEIAETFTLPIKTVERQKEF